MRTCYVELTVEEWLSQWMPGDDPVLPPGDKRKFDFRHITFDDVKNTKKTKISTEKELYPVMCEVVQNIFDLASEAKEADSSYDSLKIMDTSVLPELSTDKCCPDNSIYRKSDVDALSVEDDLGLAVARNSFSKCISGIKLKVNSRTDPWGTTLVSDDISFCNDVKARDDRAHNCQYFMEVEGRQHRRFATMVFILNRTARFLLFDRIAGVTSVSFDYVDDPAPMQKFFYRLALSDDYGRGYDPTVTTPRPEDIDKLRRALAELPKSNYIEKTRKMIRNRLDPDKRLRDPVWPLYEVAVCDQSVDDPFDPPVTYRYIIGKPETSTPSLFGRATKGFMAFDPLHDRFVFLKDSWRPDSSRPEWETYRRLKKADVPNIPTLVCGSDVRSSPGTVAQTTLTHHLFKSKGFQAKVHTRLVILEIGLPLSEFDSTLDLIVVVYHAFRAHRWAWQRASILHRDISDNNVLVVYRLDEKGLPVVGGLLIDWDLSKDKEQLDAEQALDVNRSGTWAFMSALRQKYPKKPFEVSDDIESFVHVLIWCGVRYLPHSKTDTPNHLPLFMKGTFITCCQSRDGFYYGCDSKWSMVKNGTIPFEFPTEPKFGMVLSRLLRVCERHYNGLRLQDLEKYLPSGQAGENSLPPQASSNTTRKGILYVHNSEFDKVDDDDSDDDLLQPISNSLPPKPLSTHNRIARILLEVIKDGTDWPETRDMTIDHLATGWDVTLTAGNSKLAGTESQSLKRSRPPSVTGSIPRKKASGSLRASAARISTRTSASGLDA
ncbi:hypothetical protein QCA50_008999 [Cerrena zonata]|uniref:Fungal-type protein kinase domain-containing protein n=1 Tax=Cerrena zonata TaxID=2478898 RepID=A0AAW0G2Q6_9APHY